MFGIVVACGYWLGLFEQERGGMLRWRVWMFGWLGVSTVLGVVERARTQSRASDGSECEREMVGEKMEVASS